MIDIQKLIQSATESGTLRTTLHIYNLVSLLALGDDGCHVIV